MRAGARVSASKCNFRALTILPLLLAVFVRFLMLPFVSDDATIYLLPWMQEYRTQGVAALGGEFSNYNFPYLFLLYAASLLPVEPLYAIKFVSLIGDVLLAVSMAHLVRQYRPYGLEPATAAVVTLFIPTVLLNAAMWGQCDSFYTAFLVLSLSYLLRNDARRAWLFWGVAFAFKLQSVFFLPALVLVSLRNRFNLMSSILAVGLWAMLSLPPMLFGRSLGSTLGIYVKQSGEDRLVAGAANIYEWLPGVTAAEGRIPALIVCSAVLLGIAFPYWRAPDSPERRVLLAACVLAVCPFLLPQMHDRYFFAAEVVSLVFIGNRSLRLVPVIFSGTGLLVYVLYFSGNRYIWPLLIASALQAVALVLLMHELMIKRRATKRNLLPIIQ